MPELKPDHRAVLKTHQFGKEIGELHFELELPSIAEFRPVALVPQSRDPHNVHSGTENWLTIANRHILNGAELVQMHQIHQRALRRAKALSDQRLPQGGGRL